jgi:hypothetical protein
MGWGIGWLGEGMQNCAELCVGWRGNNFLANETNFEQV